ncbi:hypothetical protein ACE6H2_001395 [Prunus campanulata]
MEARSLGVSLPNYCQTKRSRVAEDHEPVSEQLDDSNMSSKIESESHMVFASGSKTQKRSFKHDDELGSKVWTKSKANKAGSLATLNDISNNSFKAKRKMNIGSLNTGGNIEATSSTFATNGKMVISGKRLERHNSVQE